jgi:hypothetical protein
MGLPEHLNFHQEPPQQRKTRQPGPLQRGMINNYLTEVNSVQLTKNTLSGFLIETIGKNIFTYDDLLIRVEQRFPNLRKTDGRPYPAQNIKKSLTMALSSTGLFRKVDPPEMALWTTDPEKAQKYIE